MILKNMEHNRNNLEEALAKLPSFQPSDCIWAEIEQKLSEEPLKNALKDLPMQQPADFVWENIENKITGIENKHAGWWYAAAMLLTIGFAGFWYNNAKQDSSISYTQEVIDTRLQTRKEPVTDQQYAKLVSYCEAETIVCNNKNFKRLKQEYETLRSATDQLQKAMGKYNTEPELTRQFSVVEQEKAEVLNEMAKMI
jgi:exonuclease VII large subunit